MDTEMISFRTILVPLDGSELAERALLVAERVAEATNSMLLLVRVIPATTWAFAVPGGVATPEIYQKLLDDEDKSALDYLTEVAERLRAHDLRVETLVIRGEPASTLLDLEARTHAGLIVMASHGRTGMARFALGSVADRIIRGGHIPVLVVRPFGEDRRNARLERAVVPLDGSEIAEAALEMLQRLAGTLIRQVVLVRVVDPEARTGETAEAEQYLDNTRAKVSDKLRGLGCSVDVVVLHGAAAEQIIHYAEESGDVVIMVTHGRTGAARWAYGSVADRVLQGLHIPLLMVRISRQAPKAEGV